MQFENKLDKKPSQSKPTPAMGVHADPLIKREQFAVSLRKSKKTQIIQAKRQKLQRHLKLMGQQLTSQKQFNTDLEKHPELTPERINQILLAKAPKALEYVIDSIDSLLSKFNYVLNILKNDKELTGLEQLALLTQLRDHASSIDPKENTQIFNALVQKTDVVVVLSQMLQVQDNEFSIYMKYSAFWTILNLSLCSEENLCYGILSSDILSFIDSVLSSKGSPYLNLCLQLLGNIFSDGSNVLKMILQDIPDLLQRLLSLTISLEQNDYETQDLLLFTCDNIRQFCLKCLNGDEKVRLVEIVVNIVGHSAVEQAEMIYMRGLQFLNSFLKQSKNKNFEKVYSMIASQKLEIIPALIRNLTDTEDYQLVKESSLLISYLSQAEFTGPEIPHITQTFLENGLLEAYASLLDQEMIFDYEKVLEEMAFTMSNMATERPTTILGSDAFQSLSSNENLNKYSASYISVQFTIGNALTCMEPQDLLEIEYTSQRWYFVESVAEVLSGGNRNNSLIMCMLDGLECLIKADAFAKRPLGDQESNFTRLEGYGLMDNLMELQKHPDYTIYNKVEQIRDLITSMIGDEEIALGEAQTEAAAFDI